MHAFALGGARTQRQGGRHRATAKGSKPCKTVRHIRVQGVVCYISTNRILRRSTYKITNFGLRPSSPFSSLATTAYFHSTHGRVL